MIGWMTDYLQHFDSLAYACGLQGWKNRSTPFPGQMSKKLTKPGSVCLFLLCCKQGGICRWSHWGGRDGVAVAHQHKMANLVPYLEIQWPEQVPPPANTTLVVSRVEITRKMIASVRHYCHSHRLLQSLKRLKLCNFLVKFSCCSFRFLQFLFLSNAQYKIALQD